MGEDARAGRTGMTEPEQPEVLREEIEQTREELGETVEALAAKTDVKAAAQRKLETAKSSVAQPLPLAAAGGVAAGFVIWRVVARRRAARRRERSLQQRVIELVAVAQRVVLAQRER